MSRDKATHRFDFYRSGQMVYSQVSDSRAPPGDRISTGEYPGKYPGD